MYICPTCGKQFEKETWIQKHFLSCWREIHPGHQSNPAPRTENVSREVNDDFFNFFSKYD